ncbi:NUDIX hydrolase domain-like protein [Annulohypoxylon truncatum]|uniref:NUDIX hydrolase domain-like protein n=1 Tax=Annulohypoxylon truncatum TaxID=327061 RepID=UPI002008AD73|nr:NUDIX hydrolase domain-like protein [Annulohypoxylon truncatum]KAI1206530.1 NUDIX hydrolase domain-like protein [Annulohypoxylon truncatum]
MQVLDPLCKCPSSVKCILVCSDVIPLNLTFSMQYQVHVISTKISRPYATHLQHILISTISMKQVYSLKPSPTRIRLWTAALSSLSPTQTSSRKYHPSSKTKMSHQKTQEPVINKVSELPVDQAKWVTLKRVDYTDQVGKQRTWEVATRKTRGKAGVDAVAMGNVLLHPSRPASTMLVIQYRPPLDAYTVEWPAGLIDAEETAEQAAVREFKEETGYDCSVLSVSPVQAADPGMTDANMQLVMVEVKLREGDEEPDQRLEDGEHIQRVVVPLSELYDRLVEYSKADRTIIAAKLFHFAAGMKFTQTQKYF